MPEIIIEIAILFFAGLALVPLGIAAYYLILRKNPDAVEKAKKVRNYFVIAGFTIYIIGFIVILIAYELAKR